MIDKLKGKHFRGRLAVAFKDKVGNSQKRSAIIRCSLTIEAGLRTPRIVMRKLASPVESTGFAHERGNLLRPNGLKIFFAKHRSHESSALWVAILHRVNQRQRHFAFLQIAENRLAEWFRGTSKIQ